MFKTTIMRQSTVAIGVMLVGCTSAACLANTESSAVGAISESGDRLEEIVVTAQKREEPLQSVPISVQVVSNTVLAQQNYNDLSDLSEVLPDVHVVDGFDSNNLFIRGVGTTTGPSADQTVATFVDDVYRGRSRETETSFLDLDHIEVLKGPQSTFFGNSAIAGALNIVTAKPGETWEGWARALYGKFGQFAVEGAAGGPITDILGIRVAATYNGDNGWVKNVITGQTEPQDRNWAGRTTIDFHPSTDFNAVLKVEASEHQLFGSGQEEPAIWRNCPTPPPYPATYGSLPAQSNNCAGALAIGIPLDRYENTGLPGQGNSLSNFESLLTMNYHVAGQTLTSVSDFSQYDFYSRLDPYQFGDEYLQTNEDPEKYGQFSQELRIASPTGGTFEYLAGVYFQSDHLAFDLDANAPWTDFLGPVLGIPSQYLPLGISTGFSQQEKIYSGFASLTWHATDDLKVNGGIRTSEVTKNFVGSTFYGTGTSMYGGFVPLPPAYETRWAPVLGQPGELTASLNNKAWMPSGSIQYQIDPKSMAYLSYSRGFLAGGFNGLTPFLPGGANSYSPEYVNAYEAGIKSEWFDDTLLVNLDVFRSNYSGLQVNANIFNPTVNGYLPRVANAADSRSQGVELETQWIATKNLRFSANVTYLDAYFINFPGASASTLQTFCASDYVLPYCSAYSNPPGPLVVNLAGKQMPYAANWSGAVKADYSFGLPGGYKLTTDLSPYFTSNYYLISGDPIYRVPGYVRLDGRLTLELPGGHWSMDLIGKNLTNHLIVTDSSNFYLESMEPPFTVAGQIRFKW